eukprot:8820861-Alexandrium_andersonii.AAC.1
MPSEAREGAGPCCKEGTPEAAQHAAPLCGRRLLREELLAAALPSFRGPGICISRRGAPAAK